MVLAAARAEYTAIASAEEIGHRFDSTAAGHALEELRAIAQQRQKTQLEEAGGQIQIGSVAQPAPAPAMGGKVRRYANAALHD